ncbi:gluconate transporter [Nocardioides sp. Root1257]|uniref:GntP family permease n=1 Tax=unclassified Nocardioides TaxID=2615069 RepID=UPI00070219FC|nr:MULTISPECIES: gluconate:H+ symporter [unclassified Nocardioides]KQW49488.1 gluconate transporter [Nocardioides sp. Root1257]KRC48663.1 gluconate transporter [Nocardioides sp. Root224]
MPVLPVLPLETSSDLVKPVAGGAHLVIAALVGIAVIVVLITLVKLHPFLALTLGALTVGILAGQDVNDVLTSFTTGFGTTAAGVGALIVLGAMFAKLLADSGGADQIVDTIVGRASGRMLPWAMAAVGAIIGLPMFFEIGLVLLMPVIYLVSRRAQVSLITVGIPALAGLSAMHGFVPPHPGPVTAIDLLGANLGVTLGLGILVAIPTIIVAGPLFGAVAGRWVVVEAPTTWETEERDDSTRPSFGVTIATVLLPVVLMLGKAIVDIVIDDEHNMVQRVGDVIGNPFVALLIAVIVAMFTLGLGSKMDKQTISDTITDALPPIAGILVIVAAGGGFKQVLVDTGIGTRLAEWAQDANVSVLLLAWVLAVLIRLATGSATIATITASSLMVALVDGLSTGETSLVVLAVGAGSLFFSHVNDAGFWLVKEYFGMTVGQTVKTWSIMETVLSVTGLVVVLILGIFV